MFTQAYSDIALVQARSQKFQKVRANIHRVSTFKYLMPLVFKALSMTGVRK